MYDQTMNMKQLILGAISLPIEELADQLSALPQDTKIVAYCRGPYCLMAIKAIELLKAQGFDAYRLDKSVHEWNDYVGKEVLAP